MTDQNNGSEQMRDDFKTWRESLTSEQLYHFNEDGSGYPISPEEKMRMAWQAAVSADAQAIRDAALEEAAKLLENGHFLHDASPAKMFATEAATAIRRVKSQAPQPAQSFNGWVINEAERHASAYDNDDRQDIKTDVLNAFYRGAWLAIEYQTTQPAQGIASLRDMKEADFAEAQGIAQPVAGQVIAMMIDVIRAAEHAMDDTMDDGNGQHWDSSSFANLGLAMDALDALPDDKPGYALSAAAKAEWALRSILQPAPVAGEKA